MVVRRMLLIGAGTRVREVLLPALTRAGVELAVTALVDPDPRASAELAQLGHTPPAYPTLEEAIEGHEFEVALVATPHDLHQQTVLRLMDEGVTVWKEKPFALTIDDALEIANAGGAGVRVLAHRPHAQLYTLAAAVIPTWGRVLSYRVRITRPTGDYSSTWRASAARSGGGALLDLGYHAFDLVARLVAADTESVYAITPASPLWRPRVEVEESAHLALTHAGGVTGVVEVSRCDERADVLDVCCERGRITIADDSARIRIGESSTLAHTITLTAEDDAWASMLRHHIATFNDTAIDMAESRIGVGATALITAAYASIRTGRPEPTLATPVGRIA